MTRDLAGNRPASWHRAMISTLFQRIRGGDFSNVMTHDLAEAFNVV